MSKQKKTKEAPKKRFTVYVPCVYSEIYHVEAHSAGQALAMVKQGDGFCIGECSTGKEHEGYRVKEGHV